MKIDREADMDRYLLGGSNFQSKEYNFDSMLSPGLRDDIMNIHETTMAEHQDGGMSRIVTDEEIFAANEFPKSIQMYNMGIKKRKE
jgi:hypothetical protein